MDATSIEQSAEQIGESLQIRPADFSDIDQLAQVQWQARKKGVEEGYLPERVMGLHFGEKLKDVSDEIGIKYATGELTRYFMRDPGPNNIILKATTDREIAGKASIQIMEDPSIAEFDGLEVLPTFQGKGIAMKLRSASVSYVKKNFARVNTIRFGRYNSSNTYTESHYSPDSFFNALAEKAETKRIENIDEETSIAWLDIPIDVYEVEVKRRLT